MTTRLLTVGDVHERTGFSEWKIRALARERVVDCIRSNGKSTGEIRFTEAQYEQLLDALTVRAKQAPPQKQRKPRRQRRAAS